MSPRRARSNSGNAGCGILLLLLLPYFLGIVFPRLGIVLVVASLVAVAGAIERKRGGHITAAMLGLSVLACLWCGGLATYGAMKGFESEHEAVLATAERAAAEQARAAQAREDKRLAHLRAREVERQREEEDRARERMLAESIAVDSALPWSERAAIAAAVLRKRPMTVYACQAQELLASASSSSEARALERELRATKRAMASESEKRYRAELAAARAEARQQSSLVCDDGSYSPTCDCDGSWQGCCSHHGGVSHCETPQARYVERPSKELTCPPDERDERLQDYFNVVRALQAGTLR